MKQRHRIFIAINLPADIKRFLGRYEKKLSDVPAKWIPEENLHITLLFLGDVTDVELGEVCVITKKITANHDAFEIDLQYVGYGPDQKIPPRFIWASGPKSKALSQLKRDLEDAFLEKIHFRPDTKIFAPHITLARISTFTWRAIEPEERPDVGESVNVQIPVESVEVMESELGRGGPKYTILERASLKNHSMIYSKE